MPPKKPSASDEKPASKAASAKRPASAAAAKKVVAAKKLSAKTASAPAAVAAPRERSPRSLCHSKVYDGYRTLCAKKGAECPLVKECSQHGVGSESWPVTLWHIPPEQWASLSPEDKKRVLEGKRCMSETMKKDEMLIKALDENCSKFDDATHKKPSSAHKKPSSASKKPSAVGVAAAAAGGACIKKAKKGKRAKKC